MKKINRIKTIEHPHGIHMSGPELFYRGRPVDPTIFSGFDILDGGLCKDEECRDPERIIEEAFSDYRGRRNLKDILSRYENIGLIVNDNNRPTPTYLVTDHLLGKYDWLNDRISQIHIATGTHSPPDNESIERILGKAYSKLKGKVHIHDARDDGSHLDYGRTSRGTGLKFDGALEDHDLLILVNSVEPHYFAGYTGGRKSIIPGISHYDTVEQNHSHALDENARGLNLAGNPVNEDMMEAAGIYLSGRDVLSVQLVQGPGKTLVDCFVGDLKETFMKGVEVAKSEFCRPIDKLYDIVVTFAKPPLDRTLYQAQKALENGKLALKEGGSILLIASCSEGIGASTFWDLLTSSDNPSEVLEEIKKGYKLGYHKAAKIAGLAKRSEIHAVTEMKKETLEKGFIKGYDGIEKALDHVINSDTQDKLLIPDGCVTVPLMEVL